MVKNRIRANNKRRSRKNAGRRNNAGAVGSGVQGVGDRRVSRKDNFGRPYGGLIQSLRVNFQQDFTPTPERVFSTCQLVNGFSVSTGISAGSAATGPYLQATAGAALPFAVAFTLADVLQATSFAGLFDQYRFDRVEMKIVPTSTAINTLSLTSPNATVPMLYTVLDFDDSTVPANLGAVIQYDNLQVVPYGEGLFITLKPSWTPAIYQVGAFSGYGVEAAGWIDCNSSTVPHYGVKGCITELPASSTENVIWNVLCKYYISFQNVR